jgi:5-methylcytosine-specific restriction endonuclease McrA
MRSMHDYRLSHLSDAALLRELSKLIVQDRVTTATLLAHIAEVDARRLYVPAGYPSMHAYCVEKLRLSEDAAYKRIRAARAARRFPSLFEAVAEGRLHLAAVCLIAGHLTPENAGELIAAAIDRKKFEIEAWLARRFPMAEPPAFVRPIHPRPQLETVPTRDEAAPPGARVVESMPFTVDPARPGDDRLVSATTPKSDSQLAPGPVAGVPTVASPMPERYLVQVAISKSTHDKLLRAQALLSHAVPSGNVAQVIDRALDALIVQLEKRKFGATKPLPQPAAPSVSKAARRPLSASRARHVPARIRRAVWERDQGRCTFVSSSGTRCGSRKFLEYDHIEPVARGGVASVAGVRLRCRAHNQYEAERVFGAGFMSLTREGARRGRPSATS